MTSFKINLARDYTMSGKNRTRFYWLMILYFCFCGGLFIDTARQATQSISAISGAKQQLTALRQRFASQFPGSSDIPSYAQYLDRKLTTQQQLIDQLLNNISEPIPMAECLYRVTNKLPDSVQLTDLKISSDAIVSMSFVVLLNAPDHNDPSVLVQQWKEDPDLGQLLTDITLTDRQDNVMVQEQPVTRFSCSATLKKGENK